MSSSNSTPAENNDGGKSVPLDKSPENWFAKYSRAEETPKDCFRGYSDRFNGITVDSSFERSEGIDIAKKLEGSFNDLCPERYVRILIGNDRMMDIEYLFQLPCSTGRRLADAEYGSRSIWRTPIGCLL